MREQICALLVLGACSTYPPAEHAIVHNSPPQPTATASLPSTFKLATFNVHRRPGESIARGISSDQALRDADLVVLQEVPNAGACGAACVAGQKLGMYSAYEQDFLYKEGTLGQAILSRVPLEAPRIIELPYYVNRNNALAVTVRIGDQPVALYVVHLTDELSVEERMTQLRPVLEDAARQPTPVIIAGDLNASVNFVRHKIWLPRRHAAERLEAFVRSYGFSTPVAGSGSTFRVVPSKLDGIYTRGFSTGSFGTAHGDDVSDHLALWAVLSLRTGVASQP
jgi:endonuclease/exonuclease/phosphatase family metal-dependent hydrolase